MGTQQVRHLLTEFRIGLRDLNGTANQPQVDLVQRQFAAGRLLGASHLALLRQPVTLESGDTGIRLAIQWIGHGETGHKKQHPQETTHQFSSHG